MDNRKISVVIPTWEREEMLFESFMGVYDDSRISEIVIVDDCSDINLFERVQNFCKFHPKIKLFRNDENKGCYVNKMIAVSKASEEWVCLWDSDNKFDTAYLDKIYEQEWYSYRLYAPDFARPSFNYKQFGGEIITRLNVSEFIDRPMFLTALNTMNFFINRECFLMIWDKSVEPHTADSIYFNYCWLNKSGSIYILKDLEYDHLVHRNSHYQNFNYLTGNFHEETVNKLRQLK